MANAEDEDAERRHEQRAPIELKVEYKRLNTFLYDYTKNISNGGTFIKTDRPLEVGAVFLFKLQIPGLADAISLRGEVRWVIKPGEAPPPDVPADHEPGMGIRFVYDSDQQRELIEQSVEKLMIDSLGPPSTRASWARIRTATAVWGRRRVLARRRRPSTVIRPRRAGRVRSAAGRVRAPRIVRDRQGSRIRESRHRA